MFFSFNTNDRDVLNKQLENAGNSFVTESIRKYSFADGFVGHPEVGSKVSWRRSFILIGHQELPLEQAKQLVHECLKSYLTKMKSGLRDKFDLKDFNESMGIRISFWDEAWNRRKPPNIAEIIGHGEKIKYYIVDEKTQDLVLVAEEPYDLQQYLN